MKFYSIFGTQDVPTTAHAANENNSDEETVVAGESRESNGGEMREIRLKWVYPMTTEKRKVIQSHHTILGMMLKAHPELIVIDNKAQEHSDKKTMKPTEKYRPFEFYNDTRNSNNKSLVCIHRIRTMKPLSELKEAWGVFEELNKHKAYVRTHAFGEKDREISHLGFIPGLNMVHVSREHVKKELLERLKEATAEVPNFEIVQVRVDMGKGSKISERTRAYEIQCVQKDASSLAKLLQSDPFKRSPIYVPYRIKRSDPKTFKRAITRQIRTLSEQWVIKLQGLSVKMMEMINPQLYKSHIEGIVPTKNVQKGEWKLLVHKEKYKETICWLKENWKDIMDTIPIEMHMGCMPEAPKIASRNSAITVASSEDGTVDTYGTILSSLYDGYDDHDTQSQASETAEESQSENPVSHPVSYAQVLAGTNSSVSQVSGWTEHRNDEMAKLKEKHSTLEDKFNNVTAELIELKSLLQQLLSQGQNSTTSEPPTKKQAMFETPKRNDRQQQRSDHSMDTDTESVHDSEAGQYQQEFKCVP